MIEVVRTSLRSTTPYVRVAAGRWCDAAGSWGRSVACGVFLALLLGVAPLSAQSGLERVEELTRMGRTDEARTLLTEWWDGDREDAARRELQRGLWLRGRLTVDPGLAALEFQQLAVLYPSGQFTPDAIFRLAQSSWAMGDEQAARSYVETLERDYPRADASSQAKSWLASAGPLPPRGDTPTRAGADAVRTVRPSTAEPRREAAQPATGASSTAESSDETMNYYVQLGAFGDQERAFAVYDQAREAGIDVRVVRVEGSNFTHVRVGRFAERTAAVDLLEQLAARGVSAALVRDDRTERVVRPPG